MKDTWRDAGSAPKRNLAGHDLPSVEGVTHDFVDLPGLRMHVTEAGSGAPILLLHGCPVNWYAWHKMIPALAAEHRVICPDLRGFGWTNAPPSGYTRDQSVADVTALLDALELDQVTLVSEDLHAITGYGLCWDHPERIKRHICVGVPPMFINIDIKVLPRFRHLWHQEVLAMPGFGAALSRRGRQRLLRHMLAYPPGRQPWTAEETKIFLAPWREPTRARALSAMVRHMVLPQIGSLLTGRYRSRRLTTPTLVTAGTDDPVFPPHLIQHLLADSADHADHVQVADVPGAAHFQSAEKPERLVELILNFKN